MSLFYLFHQSVNKYTAETSQQIISSTSPANNSEIHPQQVPASKMAGSNFECQVCLYDKQEPSHCIIDDCPVCNDCVKESILPLFHKALEHEHDYPPRWGTKQLNPADFLHLLGKNFIDRYRRREVEYQSVDRIYCRHKIRADTVLPIGEAAPLGKVLALTPVQINQATLDDVPIVECGALASGRLHRQNTTLLCYHCTGWVCGFCERPIVSPGAFHFCVPPVKTTIDEVLKDQVRGRDYQVCPSCESVTALADGCNSIFCPLPCGTDFCFICGEQADHDSGHWAEGKPCPRWNHPDDDNAHHDPLDEEDDRPNMEAFFTEIVLRGQQLIDGGGQLNVVWLRGQIRELAGMDVREEDLLGDMDDERLWHALLHVQRILATTAGLVPVVLEIYAWAERQGLTVADQAMQQMLKLGNAVVGNHATHQTLIARPEEPPEEVKRMFAAAHRSLTVAMGTVLTGVLDDELPALKNAVDVYMAGLPAWLT
ncbi:hypothetical protein LTR37_006392 [Vermiconidia calcicola]|uniref:Uncharacterized protein n=1 Tax=Vermiconidia calcicola TaxID=1690605 RepID=A0ACC3NHI6_9PEZI|nr:hypothetical protein LTR37_006392 [Vermiconidia calcicola]